MWRPAWPPLNCTLSPHRGRSDRLLGRPSDRVYPGGPQSQELGVQADPKAGPPPCPASRSRGQSAVRSQLLPENSDPTSHARAQGEWPGRLPPVWTVAPMGPRFRSALLLDTTHHIQHELSAAPKRRCFTHARTLRHRALSSVYKVMGDPGKKGTVLPLQLDSGHPPGLKFHSLQELNQKRDQIGVH